MDWEIDIPLAGRKKVRNLDAHVGILSEYFGERIQQLHSPLNPASLAVFLVFTNRSGSNLIGQALSSSGLFKYPEEDLNTEFAIEVFKRRNTDYLSRYMQNRVIDRSKGSRAASKLSVFQFELLKRTGVLDAVFPNRKVIICQRSDKIDQAVSWIIAEKTNKWTSECEGNGQAPAVTNDEIAEKVRYLAEVSAYTDQYFGTSNEDFVAVNYEFMSMNPIAVGNLILEFIGHPQASVDLNRITLRKQATGLNAELKKRYIESIAVA